MSATQTLKPIHGTPKPVNVPADMQDAPPVPCEFKVGDQVIYTNENGASFERTVRGFASIPHGNRFVYVHKDCWWFPAAPADLRHVAERVAA